MTQLPSGRDMFTAKQYVPPLLEADVLASLRGPVDGQELADVEADGQNSSDVEAGDGERSNASGQAASTSTSSYY